MLNKWGLDLQFERLLFEIVVYSIKLAQSTTTGQNRLIAGRKSLAGLFGFVPPGELGIVR
jgi:hypothetical protein